MASQSLPTQRVVYHEGLAVQLGERLDRMFRHHVDDVSKALATLGQGVHRQVKVSQRTCTIYLFIY